MAVRIALTIVISHQDCVITWLTLVSYHMHYQYDYYSYSKGKYWYCDWQFGNEAMMIMTVMIVTIITRL